VLLLTVGALATCGTGSSSAFDVGPIVTQTIELVQGSPTPALIEGVPTDIFAPAWPVASTI
jgi:hypothetical protein